MTALLPDFRTDPPGTPKLWRGRLVECDRWEWRVGDPGDPIDRLVSFLDGHGLENAGHGPGIGHRRGAALLVGAAAGAVSVGAAPGQATPAPAIPDVAAIVYDLADTEVPGRPAGRFELGEWRTSWTDADHEAAIRSVRAAIARGDVYQVNVVGHRSAAYSGDAAAALDAVANLPGAVYGGVVHGDGWALSCASPECMLTVADGRASTRPIKGTRPSTPSGRQELLADLKERAEHIMIVDLERNDLGRVAVPGTIAVEELFGLRRWSGLWQAESTVSARLRPEVALPELLRAVLPGGSVTGAPKHAALRQIAALEPVGRGPAMGALGFVTPDRIDLGLSIRVVGVDPERLHVWAGGGITWGSDPASEVAEAHAKAAPILSVLRATATNG